MTTDGNWYFYNTPNGSNTRYTTMVLERTGYVIASNSIRSPIFHDSDNTAYYTDPASTSNLLGLTVTNTITGSITGNADTVDGFHASQSTIANGIVVRDANGYIFGNYVNMADDGNPGGGTAISSFITKQGDNYYRSVSPTNAMVSIRNVASGSWGINITGSAGSVAWSNITSKPTLLQVNGNNETLNGVLNDGTTYWTTSATNAFTS